MIIEEEVYLAHASSIPLSTKPWSDFTAADYTLEQWHKACLIHDHTGTPDSKSQCKLPIREPSGVINRNGLFAAAGALAGARTEMKATADQKNTAAEELLRIYKQIGQTPPHSLYIKHADLEDFLNQHGIEKMSLGKSTSLKSVKESTVDFGRNVTLDILSAR